MSAVGDRSMLSGRARILPRSGTEAKNGRSGLTTGGWQQARRLDTAGGEARTQLVAMTRKLREDALAEEKAKRLAMKGLLATLGARERGG